MATSVAIKRGVYPSLTRIIEDDMVLYYAIPANTTENLSFEVKTIGLNDINLDAKISYDNGAHFSNCAIPISVDGNVCPNPIIKVRMLYDGRVILRNFVGSLSEVYIAYPNIYQCSFSQSNITRCKINVANVENMVGMFNYCRNLVKAKITGLGSLYPNYGTNLMNMFRGCGNLTEVSLSDTRYVTNMDNMFAYCGNLVNAPQLDTRSVTSMGSMFVSCSKLLNVPQMDTSNVLEMGSMFMHCTSLVEKPNIFIRADCNVRNMYYGTKFS